MLSCAWAPGSIISFDDGALSRGFGHYSLVGLREMTFSTDSKPFFKTRELVNLKKLAEGRFVIYVGGCGYVDFDGRGQGGGHDFSAAGFFLEGGRAGSFGRFPRK